MLIRYQITNKMLDMKRTILERPSKCGELTRILRTSVLSNKIPTGGQFFSQNILCEQYNVSQSTVREAIGALVHEGLLYRKQGKGTFVAEKSKNKKIGTIGIVSFGQPTGTFTDFVLLDLLRGVQKAAGESGYNSNLLFREEDITIKEFVSSVLESHLDGIILIEKGSVSPEIINSPIPKVVINSKVRNIPFVWSDEENGVYSSTHYLISLGHRKIGYMGGGHSIDTSSRRYNGYEKALREAGILIEKELIKEGIIDRKDGYSAMREFISSGVSMTALVCDSDLKAIGAMEAAKEQNLRIPQDLSIVGFDDMPLAAKSIPPLTTVYHPRMEIGYQGAKLLLKIMMKTNDSSEINLHTKLVVRESCKKIEKNMHDAQPAGYASSVDRAGEDRSFLQNEATE